MAKRFFFSAFGAILVAAVVVGVAVGVNKQNADDDNNLVFTSKAATNSICSTTDFPDICESTLNSSGSTNVPDAILQSIQALAQEVQNSYNLSNKLAEAAKDPMNQQAFSNCMEVFTDAATYVQMVIDNNGVSNATNDQVDEVLTFISAVTAYATGCVEDIADPDLKKTMDEGLVALYQLSSNALTMITNIRDILSNFGFSTQDANGRRLLAEEDKLPEMDADGYPNWIGDHDRKLLGKSGGNSAFKPNVVVAQDGSGQFKSVQDALDAMPKNFVGRYLIYVKAGVYNEYVIVKRTNVDVLMYGDGSTKTIITGSKNFIDHTPTFSTAPFTVLGTGFVCMYMGFSNTAGPKGHQAVAVRVTGDRAVFFRCRMDGYQDTLYAHAMRQFYRNCVISGTIDFIFGDATAIIQNSLILVRRPDPNQFNAITASGRTARDSTTGIVIHNSRIEPDAQLFPVRKQFNTYLGRPWKPYARAIFMETLIGDLVQPVGYTPWDANTDTGKLYYGEYGNEGPGAATGDRVNWPGFHVLNRDQAQQFTVATFLDHGEWLRASQVQYLAGLRT